MGIGRSVVEIHCLQFVYFFPTSLGEGVKVTVCVFEAVHGPNMTSTFFCFFSRYGIMICPVARPLFRKGGWLFGGYGLLVSGGTVS